MDFSLDRPIHDLAEEVRQDWETKYNKEEVVDRYLFIREIITEAIKKIPGADQITDFDVFFVTTSLVRTYSEEAVNAYLVFLDSTGVGPTTLRNLFKTLATTCQQSACVVDEDEPKKAFEEHYLLFTEAVNIKS